MSAKTKKATTSGHQGILERRSKSPSTQSGTFQKFTFALISRLYRHLCAFIVHGVQKKRLNKRSDIPRTVST